MSCPSSEALVAAAAPDAGRDVRERIADHLITCGRCAEEFRVLQEIGPWASDHVHLLGESAGVQASPVAARRFGSVWAYATAAVLALAVAGLEVQVRQLKRDNLMLSDRAQAVEAAAAPAPPAAAPSAPLEARIAEQERAIAALEQRLRSAEAPDLNAPIIDLEPADAARSATPTPKVPVAAASGRSIVFVLNTSRPAAGATYEVDLLDAGGRVLWTGSGLTQSADRTLTLVVPRALVSEAKRLRLFSRAASRRTLVEEYAVPVITRP